MRLFLDKLFILKQDIIAQACTHIHCCHLIKPKKISPLLNC